MNNTVVDMSYLVKGDGLEVLFASRNPICCFLSYAIVDG
jgi:hypothetical protein